MGKQNQAKVWAAGARPYVAITGEGTFFFAKGFSAWWFMRNRLSLRAQRGNRIRTKSFGYRADAIAALRSQ